MGFLAKKPTGEILESYVTIGDKWASDVGIYEVRVDDIIAFHSVFVSLY